MNSTFQHINHWLIFALTLFLSIFERAVPPIIILLTIGAILEFVTTKSKARLNKGMIYSLIFYGLFGLGMLYSENIEYGLADLGVKFSFLAFPIIAFFLSKRPSGKLGFAISGLIVGAIIGSVICWGNYFFQYLINDQILSYGSFSILMHSSYFSLNLDIAFVFLFYFIFLSKTKRTGIQKFIGVLILGLFVGTVMVVSSKTGILTLVLAVSICLFSLLYRFKKSLAYISVGCILLLVIGVIQFNPRMNAAFNSISSIDLHKNQVYGTIDGRIFIWRQAKEVIEKNPVLGVGTGDVRDELFDNYKDLDVPFQDEIRLNCHNQYLETYLACGVLGALFLCFFLLQPLFSRNRHFLITTFVLLMFLNLMFESMLNRQAGVILLALFYQLFWLRVSLNIPITIPMLRDAKRKDKTDLIPEEGISKS
ncbi:MAG: O-antigen ligase [Parvicellaceae bacterium]|jgi:O-antigen ligase